ncbi:MAG: iron-sulfur cluster assembly accessory protein [Anaerolineales bacterium]|nr:iron-sulfur cluster assembly accessory protein [Anaerolineales bacterium]MDW8279083.1 iron-sulfur cluster assembly accessory protein [Anaerolineales bacterium]
MLQEIEPNIGIGSELIYVSPAAADAVKNILEQRSLQGYALRVYVAGGGCCSTQFGMALDNNIRTSDISFQSAGIQVVVDEMSIEYLRGARIDFVNDPLRGAGFIIDSPLASTGGSCGCSTKHESHEHAEESAGCGCGGGACGCGGH